MPEYLSQYLTVDEYTCNHCGRLPPYLRDGQMWTDFPALVELFEAFDLLRSEYGRPIHVKSGWRCPEHNATVGGEALSVHLFGYALDPDFDDPGEVWLAHAKLQDINPDLRIGAYTITGSFLHMDTGYHISPMASKHWHKGKRWFR